MDISALLRTFVPNSFDEPTRAEFDLKDAKTVEKPWGWELWFGQSEEHNYLGKLIYVKAGEKLSIQYHHEKDETLCVLIGRLYLHKGPIVTPGTDKIDESLIKRLEVAPGIPWHNAPYHVHTMEAITDCLVLEVQTNKPMDLVRLNDKYGRKGNQP